jgi:autotransporter-associated beta strand protein
MISQAMRVERSRITRHSRRVQRPRKPPDKYHLERLEDRTLLSGAPPIYPLPEQHRLGEFGTYISPPSSTSTSALDIALDFLESHADPMGILPQDVANAVVTDQYVTEITGTTHIYLMQQFNGLPVVNATIAINVAVDGQVINVGGGFLRGLSDLEGGSVPNPMLTAAEAIVVAASEWGVAIETPPVVIDAPVGLNQVMLLEDKEASLDPIPARLAYVATDAGAQLAWDIVLRTNDGQHWYNVDVDAATGETLIRSDWIDDAAAYKVYPLPAENPNDGTRVLVVNPANAAASPFGWQDIDGFVGAEFTDTRGNNASAQEDTDADDHGGFRPDGGQGLQFDFPLNLGAAPNTYQSAAITSLFYWNNILHDVHQRFGFTEAAGNFQKTNYSGQGLGSDSVQADAQDGSGTNNANFGTPPDGSAPRMQQYVFTYTNPNRDSDIDAGVIIHEYGHGVSNRLTGGPANTNALNARQSGGMGEGWSDWWAMTFTQKVTDTKNAAYPVGTYVIGQSLTGGGIRRYPYSFNMATDPLTYGDYNNDPNKEVHNTGEIWCTTLWDMNWLLIDKYGFDPDLYTGYAPSGPGSAGNKLALQLVMDGLKLQIANPSFIDARNAILAADVALTGGANQREIWTAFARRSLGFSASTASSNSGTVTLATDLPAAMSNPGIIAQLPVGVTNTALSSLDFTFSEPMNPASFDPNVDVISFTGPTGNDIRGQITGFSWPNSSTLRITFNTQTAQGPYVMVVGPNILASDNGSAMDQNTNGTAGESTNDRFTATVRYDAVAMQVSSTAPADASTVTLPFTVLDVNFNESYAASSVGVDDLELTSGTVTAFTLIDSDTVRYVLKDVTDAPTLTLNIKYGSITDSFGFPMKAYAGSFQISDITTIPFTTPLVAVEPLGSLIYDPPAVGVVNAAGDVDKFTIALDAGVRLTALVHPTSSLRPAVEVRDSSNALLGSNTAAVAGRDAIAQSVLIDTAGTYTVSVTGAASTTGSYAVQAFLNAALEGESYNGPANDTTAAAQSLSTAFLTLSSASDTASVLGTTDINYTALANEVEPNNALVTANIAAGNFSSFSGNLYHVGISGTISPESDTDYFNIGTLQSGDVLTITESGSSTSRGSLLDPLVELYRAGSSTAVASNDDAGPDIDSLIYRFSITTTDTYYVRATKFDNQGIVDTGTYSLAMFLENSGAAPNTGGTLTTEAEPNDSTGTANDASSSWRVPQYRSSTAGAIVAGDSDVYRFQFNAGDLVTVLIDSLSSLNARVSLLDAANNTIAFEDGSSVGPGNDSPIYGFIVPTTGPYYLQVQASSGTGTYNADVYLSAASAPPAPADGLDLYSFSMAANQTVSLVLKSLATGNVDLAILNSGGTVQATGSVGATNLDESIANFQSASGGTYYARVKGDNFVNYSLVVARGAAFDAEPNNDFDTAQAIGSSRGAMGRMGATDDWYQFTANANELITLTTSTPGGGANEFVNGLDPLIELYGPSNSLITSDDNSAGDGRNAKLLHAALVSGSYRARVRGAASSVGEYFLSIKTQPINIHVTGASLVNVAAVDGEQLFSQIAYDTSALVPSAHYDIEFKLDGVPVLLAGVSSGAGLDLGNWLQQSGGWILTPGSHTLTVTADPNNAIAETNETDNIATLTFDSAPPNTLPQKFTWPLAPQQANQVGVVNYVDVDPRGTVVADFRGGAFASDGHNGIDLDIANFTQMDSGAPVYAGAAGTVSLVEDGHPDRETSLSSLPSNRVEIDHGNGWKTGYDHLLTKSITVSVGQSVSAHQLIGLVGSSGDSTDAHLHFGVYHNGYAVEPFENISGYFGSPLPIYQGDQAPKVEDSGVTNYDATGDFKEGPSSRAVFTTDESVAVNYWYRLSHLNAGDQLKVRWYRPDSSLAAENSYSPSATERYVAQLWQLNSSVWSLNLGTWHVAVVVNGAELSRSAFVVALPGSGVPEIRVRESGGRLIPDGRTSAVDFGTAPTGGAALQRVFAIENHGGAALSISGIQLPPGFSLVGSLPSSIAASASGSITIQLDTVVPGIKFGALRLITNDADESVEDFNLAGIVTGAPGAGTPSITLPGPALAYRAGRPPVAISPTAVFSDSDSTQFGGGQVTVEFAAGGRPGDRLTLLNIGTGDGQIGVNGSAVTYQGVTIGTLTTGTDSTPLTVSLNSNATPAAMTAMLRAAAYSNLSSINTAPRYVRYTASDETGKVSNQPFAAIVTDVVPDVTTTVVINSGGDLVVTDIHSVGKDNQFTITCDGSVIVMADANGWFSPTDAAAIPGAVLSNGDRTLTVPLGAFAGSLIVNAAGGNDNVALQVTDVSNTFQRGLVIDDDGGIDSIHLSSAVNSGSASGIILAAETIELSGNLQTDGGAVSLIGNVILSAGSVIIDTEIGNDGSPGGVSLSGGSVSSTALGRDLSINTSTGGSANAGAIGVAGFANGGGQYVRNLSLTATSGGGLGGDVSFAGTGIVAGTVAVSGKSINVFSVLQSSDNPIVLTASNNIAFIGAAASINAGSASATLNSNAAGTGGIFSGNAANDVNAATLSLTAGSSGIGSGGNPLSFDADFVDATTTASPIYLGEANSVIVGSSGLNAGSAMIHLETGLFTLGGVDRIANSSGVEVVTGATFSLNGKSETVGSIAGGGSLILGAGTLTTGADNTYSTFSGVISGSGGLTKIGTGSFYLRGNNNYSGVTTVMEGSVIASVNNALGTVAGGTIVNGGGTARLLFDSGVNYTTAEPVTINGAGLNNLGSLLGIGNTAFAGPITLGSASTVAAYPASFGFTLNGAISTNGFALTVKGTANLVLAGVVSGSGSITKEGSNTLTLSNTNTYNGTTVANAGTVLVTGSIASSAVTVNSGAIVGGPGSLASATASGGTVSPGIDVGILSGSSADFAAGGILRVQVKDYGTAGSSFDRLNLSGSLTTDGTSKLVLDLAGLSSAGTATGIVLYAGRSGVFTTVDLLNNPNGYFACLTYGGTALDVTIQSGICPQWATAANDSPIAIPDLLNVAAARTLASASRGVTIASLDSGVDYTHPAIARNIWINQGEIPAEVRERLTRRGSAPGRVTLRDLNRRIHQSPGGLSDRNGNGVIDGGDLLSAWSDGVDNDGNGYVDDIIGWDFVNNDNDPIDDSGHGTHGAGIMAQVAPRAEVLPLKILNADSVGSLDSAIRAVDYALAQGVTISSNGWAASVFSQAWLDELGKAERAGHLFVTAAGNGDPRLLDILSQLHRGNVLVVTAGDRDGQPAAYANWDLSTVDLRVPGTSIVSAMPLGQYAAQSGTSVSTALAAGLAAVASSRHPGISRAALVDAILENLKRPHSSAGEPLAPNAGDRLPPVSGPAVVLADRLSARDRGDEASGAADLGGLLQILNLGRRRQSRRVAERNEGTSRGA